MSTKYSTNAIGCNRDAPTQVPPYLSAAYVTRSPSDVSISAGNGRLPTSSATYRTPEVRKDSGSGGSGGRRQTGIWRRLFHRHDFRRAETERLYSAYSFRSRFVDIRAVGVLLTGLFLSQAVVDFVCAAKPTIDSVTNVGLGAATSVLLVVLHSPLVNSARNRGRLPLVAGAVVCVCLVFAAAAMLPVARPKSRVQPAEGVWRLCYVILAVCTMVPLRLYVGVGVAVVVCIAHGAVAVCTFVDGHPGLLSRQVIANTILMVGVLLVGICIHDRRQRVYRKLFAAVRQCSATGLRIHDERAKMERLLASIVPQHLVAGSESKLDSLCRRLPLAVVGGASRTSSSSRPQTHECVSMLFADIVGLASLTLHSSPGELVHMLNELFGRFDQLAVENHCTRIQLLGDCFYAVCGLPDVRPDHAKCCVELGLDLVDIINFIRDSTEANIGIRVGVHSGRVESGVVGYTRWRFDVWSSDACLAEQVVQSSLPGRVHITEDTMNHLHGEFDIEVGHGDERNEYLRSRRIRTYFIVSDQPRKRYGPVKLSLDDVTLTSSVGATGYQSHVGRQSVKNISCLIAKLVSSSVRFSADVPFANVFPHLIAQANGPNSEAKEFTTTGANVDTPLLCNGQVGDGAYYGRLDRQLSMAIGSGMVDKAKCKDINGLTLCFKAYSNEYEYKNQCDKSFPSSMLYCLLLLAMSVAVQALVLPRTLLLLLLFLISFAWMSLLLMLFLGYRIKCITCDIRRSWHVRLALTTVTIFLVASISIVNVMCCHGGRIFPFASQDPFANGPSSIMSGGQPPTITRPVGVFHSVIAFNRDQHLTCEVPHYVHLAAILSLSTVAIFKMAAIGRLAFLLVLAGLYVVVVEFVDRPIFDRLDLPYNKPDVPTDVAGVFMMFHFVIALYVVGRFDEWTRRLLFLWNRQSVEQQHELTDVELENDRLLNNILPRHVLPFFTVKQHSQELYCESYSRVIVGFASVANFYDSEYVRNAAFRRRQGLRLLSDIISAFDELLEEHRFVSVDKVKTVGNCYMFALGLKPDYIIEETEQSLYHNMSTTVQLITAMNERLFHINDSFTLRVGLDVGPAVAGLIGARKPQFDMWGGCINVARCLERCGLVNCVNVTVDVYRSIQTRFKFQCRGPTRLRDKAREITTYYLPLDTPGYRQLPAFSSPVLVESRINQSVGGGGGEMKTSNSDTFWSNISSVPLPCVVQSCATSSSAVDQGPITSTPMINNSRQLFRSSSATTSRDNGHQTAAAAAASATAKISMTPPSSLGRRRRLPDVAVGRTPSTSNGVVGVVEPTRRNGSSNGSNGNFLGIQNDLCSDGGKSPDLPVVHFRNSNIVQNGGGGSGNLNGSNCTGLCNSAGVWGMIDSLVPSTVSASTSSRTSVEQLTRQHSAEESRRMSASGSGGLSGLPDPMVRTTSTGSMNGSLPTGTTRSNGVQPPSLPSIDEMESSSAAATHPAGTEHESAYSAVLKKEDLDVIMRELLAGETAVSVKTSSPGTNAPKGSSPTRKTTRQTATSHQQSMTSSSASNVPAPVSDAMPSYGVVTKTNNNNNNLNKNSNKWSANPSAVTANASPNYPVSLRPPVSEIRTTSAISMPRSTAAALSAVSHAQRRLPAPPKSAGDVQPEPMKNGLTGSAFQSRNDGRTKLGERRVSPPPLPPPPGGSTATSSNRAQPGRNGSTAHNFAVQSGSSSYQQRLSAFRPVLRASNIVHQQQQHPTQGGGQHWQTSAFNGFLPRLPFHQQQYHLQQQLPPQIPLQLPKYQLDQRLKQQQQRRPVQQQQTTAGVDGTAGSRQATPGQNLGPTPSFRVRRATGVHSLNRLCRSLDNLPSDIDDCGPRSGSSSRPDSPTLVANGQSSGRQHQQGTAAGNDLNRRLLGVRVALHPDDVSLSSFDGTGSEMSRSDPALSSYESTYGYGAYGGGGGSSCGGFDSEYDNYRPGMASDEDYFVPEPISDIDIDMFDDILVDGVLDCNSDVENVTVSETYPTVNDWVLQQDSLR